MRTYVRPTLTYVQLSDEEGIASSGSTYMEPVTFYILPEKKKDYNFSFSWLDWLFSLLGLKKGGK